MASSWSRELGHRRAEQRARLMVRVANRTFKKQPNRGDRLARRLLDQAVGAAPKESSPS